MKACCHPFTDYLLNSSYLLPPSSYVILNNFLFSRVSPLLERQANSNHCTLHFLYLNTTHTCIHKRETPENECIVHSKLWRICMHEVPLSVNARHCSTEDLRAIGGCGMKLGKRWYGEWRLVRRDYCTMASPEWDIHSRSTTLKTVCSIPTRQRYPPEHFAQPPCVAPLSRSILTKQRHRKRVGVWSFTKKLTKNCQCLGKTWVIPTPYAFQCRVLWNM